MTAKILRRRCFQKSTSSVYFQALKVTVVPESRKFRCAGERVRWELIGVGCELARDRGWACDWRQAVTLEGEGVPREVEAGAHCWGSRRGRHARSNASLTKAECMNFGWCNPTWKISKEFFVLFLTGNKFVLWRLNKNCSADSAFNKLHCSFVYNENMAIGLFHANGKILHGRAKVSW